VTETPVSLLDRLTDRADAEAWQRFVALYTPFIRGWLRRDPKLLADADDLVQEVLAAASRDLPGFERRRPGSFRAWLRTITVNRIRAHWKSRRADPLAQPGRQSGDLLAQLADPASPLSRQWDQEHDIHVAHRLLEQVAPDFEPSTFRAFEQVTLHERKSADVAVELNLSRNAVLLAKSRVLQRLRELGRGLLD
jgi:RNA polymerase sigma-70 factor (ECF subfamily)